uniref:Uncharacterized protein n=1 Tax=Tetraselmis sp. GSL018 TaxID=582737 RepID=A0A061QU18_9CHLO
MLAPDIRPQVCPACAHSTGNLGGSGSPLLWAHHRLPDGGPRGDGEGARSSEAHCPLRGPEPLVRPTVLLPGSAASLPPPGRQWHLHHAGAVEDHVVHRAVLLRGSGDGRVPGTRGALPRRPAPPARGPRGRGHPSRLHARVPPGPLCALQRHPRPSPRAAHKAQVHRDQEHDRSLTDPEARHPLSASRRGPQPPEQRRLHAPGERHPAAGVCAGARAALPAGAQQPSILRG